jgi:hypothetical protein
MPARNLFIVSLLYNVKSLKLFAAGRVAQVVEHLPRKHEALSLKLFVIGI